MSYSPTWENGTDGRVVGGEHWIKAIDIGELREAVHRRLRIVNKNSWPYFAPDDSAADIADGYRDDWVLGMWSHKAIVYMRETLEWIINNHNQIFDMWRAGESPIVYGYAPHAPSEFEWLWPVSDADEGKQIVTGTPGANEVNIFDKLNGTATWTEDVSNLSEYWITAVHLNEIRQVVEWLIRGRWTCEIDFWNHNNSYTPDSGGIGGNIFYSESGEAGHAFGDVILNKLYEDLCCYDPEDPPRGLIDVEVLSTSKARVYCGYPDYYATLWHCDAALAIRSYQPDNWDNPSWNKVRKLSGPSWSDGGKSASTSLGSITTSVGNLWQDVTGSAVVSAIQDIIDGTKEHYFMLTPGTENTYYETMAVDGELVIDFELKNPPN